MEQETEEEEEEEEMSELTMICEVRDDVKNIGKGSSTSSCTRHCYAGGVSNERECGRRRRGRGNEKRIEELTYLLEEVTLVEAEIKGKVLYIS